MRIGIYTLHRLEPDPATLLYDGNGWEIKWEQCCSVAWTYSGASRHDIYLLVGVALMLWFDWCKTGQFTRTRLVLKEAAYARAYSMPLKMMIGNFGTDDLRRKWTHVGDLRRRH